MKIEFKNENGDELMRDSRNMHIATALVEAMMDINVEKEDAWREISEIAAHLNNFVNHQK